MKEEWALDAYGTIALAVAAGAFVVLVIAWFYFDDDRCF